jgi:hypothetical protein
MRLKVEGVMNRTVHAEEALGRAGRLDPPQTALASSHCLMRILRPIASAHPEPLPQLDMVAVRVQISVLE